MTSQPSPVRPVREIVPSERTLEGAGVPVHRAFGSRDVPKLDPFLLLDDLRSDNPLASLPGFPWHPHRGIETVTYMLAGRVDHEDSLGNKGTIKPGGVQWMTAGSGIVHQEMPKPVDGSVGGFQLWVNLPQRLKMRDPRYRELEAPQIPLITERPGVRVGAIAGGDAGAVRDLSVDVEFLDVRLEKGARFDHKVPTGHTAFAYTLEGGADFDAARGAGIRARNLVVFGDGERVDVKAGNEGARFLFAAGKPLGEPIAWWGPIVMNHRHELREAVEEFQNGTFIKHAPPGRGGIPA